MSATKENVKEIASAAKFVPVIAKRVTIPLLKQKTGEPIYVKMTGAMYTGKAQKAKEGEKAKDPATLINCVDLTTGLECQIIVSAVVKSILEEEYPAQAYVGKGFMITNLGKREGKNYNSVDVAELKL